jgi:hypothetical protein
MQRTDLPARLQAILERIPYATIATVCANGQPWNSPVYARIDEDLHVYWVSWTSNQHSQNIACNPCIFVVIYDSRVPEGTGLGLYLQMRARSVLNTARVQDIRRRLFHRTDTWPLVGDNPRRLYEAIPEKIWHNSHDYLNGSYIDTRELIWQA